MDSEVTYEKLFEDIIYVDGRISKSKAFAVIAGVITFIVNLMNFISPSLRMGVLPFFVSVFITFIQILIYYGIIRGVGYLIRRFLIK